jgi:hypothetical protein
MAELGNYSEVAVANLALQYMGRGAFITALDENTQAARVMRLQLPYARDAVLRAFPWNFAQRRAALPANATVPIFEFAAAYDLPNDCLWCHTVYGGDTWDWRVEGRQVLANIGAPLNIKYTSRITDLASADPLFFQALAARLGSDCAMSLTETASKANQLWQLYTSKLREARAVDSQEGQQDSMPDGSWSDGRMSDFFAPYNDWKG